MGKTKGIGWVILVLGVVFVLGGLAVKFVVLPSQAKFPDRRRFDAELRGRTSRDDERSRP